MIWGSNLTISSNKAKYGGGTRIINNTFYGYMITSENNSAEIGPELCGMPT